MDVGTTLDWKCFGGLGFLGFSPKDYSIMGFGISLVKGFRVYGLQSHPKPKPQTLKP